MTERQCPLCHIHAIQSPATHGRCTNANCPPFEGWPALLENRWPLEDTYAAAPIVRATEPSPAPLVEVETVDGADHRASGADVQADGDSERHDGGDIPRTASSDLLPKVELIMPAPQPIRTLGETLGNILKAATERADKLAQKVQASSDELHKVMDATEEVSQDMDRVTADMKTKLGLGGNGGPAL